ncbi:MAG: hypothetical protein WC389_19040 [Lutibacter sp.]
METNIDTDLNIRMRSVMVSGKKWWRVDINGNKIYQHMDYHRMHLLYEDLIMSYKFMKDKTIMPDEVYSFAGYTRHLLNNIKSGNKE